MTLHNLREFPLPWSRLAHRWRWSLHLPQVVQVRLEYQKRAPHAPLPLPDSRFLQRSPGGLARPPQLFTVPPDSFSDRVDRTDRMDRTDRVVSGERNDLPTGRQGRQVLILFIRAVSRLSLAVHNAICPDKQDVRAMGLFIIRRTDSYGTGIM